MPPVIFTEISDLIFNLQEQADALPIEPCSIKNTTKHDCSVFDHTNIAALINIFILTID